MTETTDAQAVEMARLLEAMCQGGFGVALDSGPEAGFWWCEWNNGVVHQAKAPSMYAAVKQCWERGQ